MKHLSLQLFADAGASEGGYSGQANGESLSINGAAGGSAAPKAGEELAAQGGKRAARLAQTGGRASAEQSEAVAPEDTLRWQVQQHYDGLVRQGEELKRLFPGFDLEQELRNPVFLKMTSPAMNIPVEDAYFAVHRQELQTACMQVAAQKTAEKLSNAIRAGTQRPQENGTSAQAACVTSFDYRSASPQQRSALKRRIREAAASGKKLYPGC